MANDLISILREVRGTIGEEPVLGTDGEITNGVESGKYGLITSLYKRTDIVHDKTVVLKNTLWGSDTTNGSDGTVLRNITTKSTNVDVKNDNVNAKSSVVDSQFTTITGPNGDGTDSGIYYDIIMAEASVSPHYVEIANASNDLLGNDTTGSAYADGTSKIVATGADLARGVNSTVVAVGNDLLDTEGKLANVTETVYRNKIEAVSDNEANITAVANNETNITAVKTNEANINAVVDNRTNIDSVVSNEANITAVSENKVNINAVSANETNINTTATNIANVNAVADNKTNIDAVVANKTNIDTIASNNTNINTVADGISHIESVANNNTNISRVADNISLSGGSINTAEANAATAVAAKDEVVASTDKSAKWADENEDIEVEADRYSAKHWAAKAAAVVGDGIINDDSTATGTTFSSFKISSMNESVTEAIAGLATAQARFISEEAISPIGTTSILLPFTEESSSSNSDILELDPSADKIVFKSDAGYSYMSTLVLTNTDANDVVKETVTFKIINDADDAVLAESSFEVTIGKGESETLPSNTLLQVGRGSVPSTETENLVTRIEVASSGDIFELTSFSTILASSSAYDLNGTAGNTSVVATGNLTSENAQDALVELQEDVDTRALNSALTIEIDNRGTDEGVLLGNINTRTKKEIFKAKTENYAMVDMDYIFADTSGGAFAVSLPGSPAAGVQVSILDVGAAFDEENLTVERNGSTIMGIAEDLLLDMENSFIKLIYTGTDWRMQ